MQSSLVLNAWTNQMSVIITLVPDRVFVPTWWLCSLISSFKDVAVTLIGLAVSLRFGVKSIIAFPFAWFREPFHIVNRTTANCGFWLKYTSNKFLEVVADLIHCMLNAAFECSHQVAFPSTPLTLHFWLDMTGVPLVKPFYYDLCHYMWFFHYITTLTISCTMKEN